MDSAVSDLMGDGLKRFAFEDMTMFKELSLDMNNAMFNNTQATFSITGTTSPFNFEKNTGSNSRWALSANDNGRSSFGIGMALTKINSQDGSWHIRDEKRRDDHLVFKNSFEYDFTPFSIYGNLFTYIDSEYRTKADIGVKVYLQAD